MTRRGAGTGVLAAGGALLLVLLPAAPAGAQQDQADDANGRTITRDARDPAPVTDAMLRDPDPGDWLMSHRTYDHQGFSPLDEISRDNVHRLQLAWMRAMDEGPQQIRPLVYDGVMYVEHPGNTDHLQAWDATTGDLLWDFERQPPDDIREHTRFGDRTRNLAIYGTNIYHLTADAQLLAVDAGSGELSWLSRTADYRDGISHSSGAMIINGQVVSGRTCEPASLIARCYISAHDPDSGDERWRFYTAAGSDDPGGRTWGDLPVANRVHTSAWGLPGSYDPELDLLFWGIAVPLPYPRIVRRGTWDVGDRTPCELYSNSTVALRPGTGQMEWYYQHLPCDDWDQDFVQERTLIETVVDPDPDAVMWINPRLAGTAERRKVVVTIGEPGGLFVLDRATGEFLWAAPLPYDNTERFVIRDIDPATGQVFINMDLVARELGQQFIICGHNVKGYWGWSYSPETNLLYIPFNRSCLNQTANDRAVNGASPRFSVPEPGREDGDLTEIWALNVSTGRVAWRFGTRSPNRGTVLATAGNVVFHGDLNRRLRAFDAETGEVLWETILGSQITGYPVTYRAGGRQYLAVPVGGASDQLSVYAADLEAPTGSNMIVVFALPE